MTRLEPPERRRWVGWAAWGAFAATVPSAVWRVLMIVGLMPGTADLRRYELADDPAVGYAYVFGLSLVQLAAGFLTLGLVRPWGGGSLRPPGAGHPGSGRRRPRRARRGLDLRRLVGRSAAGRAAPGRGPRVGLGAWVAGCLLLADLSVGSARTARNVRILAAPPRGAPAARSETCRGSEQWGGRQRSAPVITGPYCRFDLTVSDSKRSSLLLHENRVSRWPSRARPDWAGSSLQRGSGVCRRAGGTRTASSSHSPACDSAWSRRTHPAVVVVADHDATEGS